jgi:serine/threonine protein kinase
MLDEAKDPLIGQTLGAYLLVEPLGRGGMATVYKAHEAALDRYVAVKILPQSLASNDDFIQRFRREAKAIAQLNHPNIVPIYSYGEERNIIYIAMQLVEGGALKREEGQVFPAAHALKLLAPIARALDYAHQHGIIHRDIKPSNILLSRDNWPMLADFGLARTAEVSQHLTATGVSMGTPRYMSPEQGRGITVDHRADIYSLGIVLYELMTGEEPFRADTPMGTIVKHITEPLPIPRRINPNISEDVENIILKAAAKNPVDRFQSAGEMAEAMESVLNVLTSSVKNMTSSRPVLNAVEGSGSRAAPKSREKSRVENPFTFGNPIKKPERFIGRTTEIRQIVNRLLSSAHESTSIIGERRIGKTSLLSYLANPDVSAGLGLTPDRFCMVYVDFQGLTDITPTRFWQRILKKMSRSICDESLKPSIDKLSEQSTFDLFDLEDLFQITMDKGLTIALLMDEFEYVTENPNFKSDFFGGLRALAIHSGVALLPATRSELVDLCHSDEIKGSPFFNIFANVVLRPFSRDEVEEMFECYTQNSEVEFTPQEKDFIWATGGGYPIFTQMAGHYLMEGKAQGLTGESLIKFASSSFDQQAEAHYAYLWSHCTENEKITLLIVLPLAREERSKKTILNMENISKLRARAPQDVISLGKRGLISEAGGTFQIFSQSLKRWIQKEISVVPGEEESQKTIEEWLVTGGQKETKKAYTILPRFKKKYWTLLEIFFKEVTLET